MSARAEAELGFEHVLVRGSGDWTLLLLHATGGDEHQLLQLGRDLSPDANLLSPRGQVLEGGTVRRFFARRGMLDLDIPDLLVRTDQLADFVAAASAAYALDPERIVAVGYSNGANIAVSLLLRHPGALAGAVLLRPTLPYAPDPAAPLRLDGKPILILGGEQDPYVPRERYDQLVSVLNGAGADVTPALAPGGHHLGPEELQQAMEWVSEHVPGNRR
ncbi:MAG: alpha/beta hydrolase [Solirubrobacteraceae bacterium]